MASIREIDDKLTSLEEQIAVLGDRMESLELLT